MHEIRSGSIHKDTVLCECMDTFIRLVHFMLVFEAQDASFSERFRSVRCHHINPKAVMPYRPYALGW